MRYNTYFPPKENRMTNHPIVYFQYFASCCPDLAQRFGIMSVPTMILFKKGQQVAAFSGYMPEAMLMQNIESKL